jgi:hypothetical protein
VEGDGATPLHEEFEERDMRDMGDGTAPHKAEKGDGAVPLRGTQRRHDHTIELHQGENLNTPVEEIPDPSRKPLDESVAHETRDATQPPVSPSQIEPTPSKPEEVGVDDLPVLGVAPSDEAIRWVEAGLAREMVREHYRLTGLGVAQGIEARKAVLRFFEDLVAEGGTVETVRELWRRQNARTRAKGSEAEGDVAASDRGEGAE